MRTLAEIRRRGAEIATRQAALAAIVQREGRTLSDAEQAEYNSLDAEYGTLQEDEAAAVAEGARASALSSQPARPRGVSGAPAVLTRTTQAQRNGDRFQGQTWARIQLAKLNAALAFKEGNVVNVPELLTRLYPTRPEIAKIAHFSIRRQAAGVEGGAVLSGEAGSELIALDSQFTGDFIEFLYSQTLFDRMGFHGVPADVTIKGQDGAFTGYWVGEKKPIPASIGSYSTVNLGLLKAAGLTYLSRSLIERSAPAAEMLFRDGVVKATAQAVDTKAFSTDAASANVSPAGLLQGLSGVASVGGRLQDLYADLAYLTGIFVTAKNTGGLKFVSNKSVANQIAHLLSPLTGLPAFAGQITEEGGTLDGRPYLTGDNVVAGSLLLVKPSDVWKIGDSGVYVSLSTDATIEADTAPTGEGAGPTAQSANMVSMFQTDSVAIKAVRDINYQFRRSQAIVIARKTSVDYDGTESTTD